MTSSSLGEEQIHLGYPKQNSTQLPNRGKYCPYKDAFYMQPYAVAKNTRSYWRGRVWNVYVYYNMTQLCIHLSTVE